MASAAVSMVMLVSLVIAVSIGFAIMYYSQLQQQAQASVYIARAAVKNLGGGSYFYSVVVYNGGQSTATVNPNFSYTFNNYQAALCTTPLPAVVQPSSSVEISCTVVGASTPKNTAAVVITYGSSVYTVYAPISFE